LLELQEQKKLKEFISLGIIPVKVFTQFEIYKYYLQELENNRREKNCVMQAVSNTAEQFRCAESTIFRAIKFNQSTK
jgi:ATP sulfurylase